MRYIQTLGTVAGIVQTVNAVEITCSKPAALVLTAAGRPGVTLNVSKPVPLVLTVKPTLKPNYGGG